MSWWNGADCLSDGLNIFLHHTSGYFAEGDQDQKVDSFPPFKLFWVRELP